MSKPSEFMEVNMCSRVIEFVWSVGLLLLDYMVLFNIVKQEDISNKSDGSSFQGDV